MKLVFSFKKHHSRVIPVFNPKLPFNPSSGPQLGKKIAPIVLDWIPLRSSFPVLFLDISEKTKNDGRQWVARKLQNSRTMATHNGRQRKVTLCWWAPASSSFIISQVPSSLKFSRVWITLLLYASSAPSQTKAAEESKGLGTDWGRRSSRSGYCLREKELEAAVRTEDVTDHQTPNPQKREGRRQWLRKLASLNQRGTGKQIIPLNSGRVDFSFINQLCTKPNSS